jgi:hypothetical protein
VHSAHNTIFANRDPIAVREAAQRVPPKSTGGKVGFKYDELCREPDNRPRKALFQAVRGLLIGPKLQSEKMQGQLFKKTGDSLRDFENFDGSIEYSQGHSLSLRLTKCPSQTSGRRGCGMKYSAKNQSSNLGFSLPSEQSIA